MSLAATNQRFESGIELILPTPTLVGIPTTETAYQALFRIYAARVLSAVITHLTGNHCCIFRTVLEKQLNQLGVFPWPLTTTTDPLSLFRNFAPLRELEPVWLLTPEEELTEAERTLLYAFVDLLVEERGMQPANLLTWRLNLVDLLSSSGESAETLWWNYVYEKGARAQRQVSFTPPYPWPRQNLYLTCRNRENENGLYRYDPAGDQWSKERAFAEGNVVVLPLPDDRGMVISTGQFERETFVLLPNGTEYPVPVDSGNVSLPSDSVSDPLGRYLLLYYTSPTVFRTVYLDINSCDEAGCNLISAEQQPVWSPDGAHVLLWSDALLQRGQSLDGPLTPVSPAGVYSHFWWDNNVPGYVAGLGDRILLVTGRNESPQVWLTADDLASAVPPEMRQGSWKIQEVSPTPDGNSFLVSASRRGQSDYHLFLVRGAGNSAGQGLDELATPVVFYLVSMPLQPRGLQFSPDGQWLAVPIFDREPTNAELFFFFDLRVPEIVLQSQLPFSMESYNLDWSADSRWLARLGDGFLEFTAPATIDMPHQHYVFPGDLSCTSLAWIKS